MNVILLSPASRDQTRAPSVSELAMYDLFTCTREQSLLYFTAKTSRRLLDCRRIRTSGDEMHAKSVLSNARKNRMGTMRKFYNAIQNREYILKVLIHRKKYDEIYFIISSG